MRALVTGAAGFLGHHFTAELQTRGWTVTRSDIRLGFDAMQIFTDRLCVGAVYDLVIHCAAVEPHRAAIDGKPMHLATNLALDAAMFDWARRTGQKRILYISSSAAYPVRLQTSEYLRYLESVMPYDIAERARLAEHHINHTQWGKTGDWSPDAGYGWLKLTGEKMATDANQAGIPTHVVRPASGCSVDQSENFPFPAIAARVAKREDPLIIWGPPGQTRDWVHVSDVVNGALAIVDADVREPVNLCTGIGTSMGELAAMLWHGMHGSLDGFNPVYDETKPTGVFYRVLNPSRMLQYYTPKWTIRELVSDAARHYFG